LIYSIFICLSQYFCFIKCGPRAWYGRFICKAFGIPTWGVKQPGHAAMTRWTIHGWDVCLGGGLWKSWWDDQCGLDFLLETQARHACSDETMFMQKVSRIQWLAQYYYREKSETVRRNGQFDAKNPWFTLCMIQRKRLAQGQTSRNILMFPPPRGGNNKIETILMQQHVLQKHIRDYKPKLETITYDADTGITVIPATSCVSPTETTNKVQFMPSFLGGQQLFVKDDAELEYHIVPSTIGLPLYPTATTAAATTMSYNLSCRVATAHRSEQPIEVTIGTTVYTIPMPYTMALWGNTEPIQVVISDVEPLPIVIRITRPKQNFGFAFKDFQLVLIQ
jgi:hypothetical protein